VSDCYKSQCEQYDDLGGTPRRLRFQFPTLSKNNMGGTRTFGVWEILNCSTVYYWNVKKGKHLVKLIEIKSEENHDGSSTNVV